MTIKVKFVKRGQASAATIAQDDIVLENNQPIDELLRVVRQPDLELPHEVEVHYSDHSGDYAEGVQYSRRLTVNNEAVKRIDLPVVLSEDEAKQLADVHLYLDWVSRNTTNVILPLKYAKLEPTDVVTLVGDDYTLLVRFTHKSNEGMALKFEATFEDLNAYSSTAAGAPLPAPIGIASPIKVTWVHYLDIPLLRDIDDGAGYYAAAGGFDANWVGAAIYRSTDSGETYNQVPDGLLDQYAIAGRTLTALGDFSTNIFDESNTVTVSLNYGTLSSVSEANALAGSNAALIGDEIVIFKTATLDGDGNYVLSGLLRGRRGTEQYTSTHAIGERFVLLQSTSVHHIDDSSANMNLARLYKAATFGSTLSQTPAVSFTNTAQGLKPYAPVQVGGGADDALNYTINWHRRTRVGGEWRDYVDASLGESSEAYKVEIYNSDFTTLKRTITGITSESTSYTAAQQVTDFGSEQFNVAVRVYQYSSTYGYGDYAQATVSSGVVRTYATLNPSDKDADITLSNGDLTASHNAGTYDSVRATLGKSSGKWYWEVTCGAMGAYEIIGIMTASGGLNGYIGADAYGWSYWSDARKFNNGSQAAYGASFTNGDVIGIALDMDAGTITMYKNGVSQTQMYSGITGTVYPAVCLAGFSTNLTCNFGASAFAYSPPSGYNAGVY